jgi:hypothetical protein
MQPFSRRRALDPYKQGDEAVGHHIIPHSLLIWALKHFEPAEQLLIQESFIPKQENLTLLNLHRTGIFKLDEENTTASAGIVNTYIYSLNSHTRTLILNSPIGSCILPVDVKIALNHLTSSEQYKQPKYRQFLAAAYYEWQRYNVFYGPMNRHEAQKKNEFDTDGKYFVDSQTYDSLYHVYKKLVKAKKIQRQVIASTQTTEDLAIHVKLALNKLQQIHALYEQGKIPVNIYDLEKWTKKAKKGILAFVPKERQANQGLFATDPNMTSSQKLSL